MSVCSLILQLLLGLFLKKTSTMFFKRVPLRLTATELLGLEEELVKGHHFPRQVVRLRGHLSSYSRPTTPCRRLLPTLDWRQPCLPAPLMPQARESAPSPCPQACLLLNPSEEVSLQEGP